MKFFIPCGENEEQMEEVYAIIAQFNGVPLKATNERLYSITYKHNGQTMVAVVGENCDPYYGEGRPLIVAIFKGNPYKICLYDRGVNSGDPILVGFPTVISESFFE